MPALSIAAARDEILALFWAAWQVGAPTVPVRWPNKPDNTNATSGPFVRVQVLHATGAQSTLAGEVGQRTFEHSGLFSAQIFGLFGKGLTGIDALVKIVVDAFEGQTTASGIWFRNVRVNEIGQDGDRFQTNVLVDFTYDIIK